MALKGRRTGITAALSSALFLGAVPIFGKLAMNSGFSPFAVIALRSSIAAVLILILMAVKLRPFFYIYPVGLVGCLLAGATNGLGSILYYTALGKMDASIAHMLYSSYPLFVAFWLLLDRQPITRLTIFRLGLSLPAVFLLVNTGANNVNILGAVMMLGSALLYALHLLINQRILYEVPAPTVTLYTLLAMGATVDIAFLFSGPTLPGIEVPWWPVLAMAFITFSSRLMLFLGVKNLGGLQTSLLGLAELLITVFLARWWLGEQLTPIQWAGAALLMLSLLLIGFDKIPPQKRTTTSWLSWLNPPKITPTDLPWNSQP